MLHIVQITISRYDLKVANKCATFFNSSFISRLKLLHTLVQVQLGNIPIEARESGGRDGEGESDGGRERYIYIERERGIKRERDGKWR